MTTRATNPDSCHIHIQKSDPNSLLPPPPRHLVSQTPRLFRPSDRYYQPSSTSTTTPPSHSNRTPRSTQSRGGQSFRPQPSAPYSTSSSSPDSPNMFGQRTKSTQSKHAGGKRRKATHVVISSDDDEDKAPLSPTQRPENRQKASGGPATPKANSHISSGAAASSPNSAPSRPRPAPHPHSRSTKWRPGDNQPPAPVHKRPVPQLTCRRTKRSASAKTRRPCATGWKGTLGCRPRAASDITNCSRMRSGTSWCTATVLTASVATPSSLASSPT